MTSTDRPHMNDKTTNECLIANHCANWTHEASIRCIQTKIHWR